MVALLAATLSCATFANPQVDGWQRISVSPGVTASFPPEAADINTFFNSFKLTPPARKAN